LKRKITANKNTFQPGVIFVFLFLSIYCSGNYNIFQFPESRSGAFNYISSDYYTSAKKGKNTIFRTHHDTLASDTVSSNERIKKLKESLINKISVIENAENGSSKEDISNNLIYGYAPLQGKIIRRIVFKQLEIFGQSVKDTNQIPSKWIEKLGNGLHINTQSSILRNQLIIKTGEPLDLFELTENERLIRELPYIDDAATLVSDLGNDSVDIIIITKDVLPLGFGLELFDVAYGRADFYDKNLLGLGHEINYNLTWDYNRSPYYGHKIRYRIQNIGSSFFSLDASYENLWDIEARKIYINRDFYSQSTKYAGGIGFEKIYSTKDILLPDSTLKDVKVDYNYYDFWIGRAILIRNALVSKSRTNIAITARATQHEFFRRPVTGEKLLYDFHNRTLCLASIGISRQGYYKSTLVYGFGRTEDIPFGFAASFTGGIEFDEFYKRPYFGINISHGSHIKNIGYLRKQVAFGGFIHHNLEQGLLITQLNYFTDLINMLNRYKYRIFVDLQYKAGYNRFEDEYMEFTKRDGIRGLASSALRGNQRLNLNIEPVCYSPHHLLGFKFVYYLFIDVGMIANESNILTNNRLYSGFGAGVRIRNDNLVFDAIHIRLGYYPVLPDDAIPEYIFLTSSSNKRIPNFVTPKPDILKYQTRF
jgi:hypothetical protein